MELKLHFEWTKRWRCVAGVHCLASVAPLRDTLLYQATHQQLPGQPLTEVSYIKGIVQPFELGGETILIRSDVKYWKPGKF